jgi:heme oxygenase
VSCWTSFGFYSDGPQKEDAVRRQYKNVLKGIFSFNAQCLTALPTPIIKVLGLIKINCLPFFLNEVYEANF